MPTDGRPRVLDDYGDDDEPPKPERLGRRRFPTWMLVSIIFVFFVVGMIFGYLPRSHNNADASTNGGRPPLPAGIAGDVTTRPLNGTVPTSGGGQASTPTTAIPATSDAPSVPSTSASPAPTSTTVVTTTTLPRMTNLVLQELQTTGPMTTTGFDVANGPYEIGYAYECQAVPVAQQGFRIVVVTPTGPLPTPALASDQVHGTGFVVVTTTGQQSLHIETASACQWTIRVIAP